MRKTMNESSIRNLVADMMLVCHSKDNHSAVFSRTLNLEADGNKTRRICKDRRQSSS